MPRAIIVYLKSEIITVGKKIVLYKKMLSKSLKSASCFNYYLIPGISWEVLIFPTFAKFGVLRRCTPAKFKSRDFTYNVHLIKLKMQ